MEYEESRAYVVGDDIKAMDWRVMARTGEAHTKIFSNELEKSLILAVDLSSSMFFGTQHSFKSWTAAQIAAHFAWLVKASDDRIGATVSNDDESSIIRPSRSNKALSMIFKTLCDVVPGATRPVVESPLDSMLLNLKSQSIKGSSIILISDFLGMTSSTLTILQQLERHNNVSAFWVHDRTEVEPWPIGQFPVRQGNQINILDTSNDSTRDWLRNQQKLHRQNIDKLISNGNFNLCEISCNHELSDQLFPFLRNPHDS